VFSLKSSGFVLSLAIDFILAIKILISVFSGNFLIFTKDELIFSKN
jgi:hypothetical protein